MRQIDLDDHSLDRYRFVTLGPSWIIALILGWHVLLILAFVLGIVLS